MIRNCFCLHFVSLVHAKGLMHVASALIVAAEASKAYEARSADACVNVARAAVFGNCSKAYTASVCGDCADSVGWSPGCASLSRRRPRPPMA